MRVQRPKDQAKSKTVRDKRVKQLRKMMKKPKEEKNDEDKNVKSLNISYSQDKKTKKGQNS